MQLISHKDLILLREISIREGISGFIGNRYIRYTNT